MKVEWIDLDDVDSPNDDLRMRGHEQGAAIFARGEGMWYDEGEIYFACTSGGDLMKGRVLTKRRVRVLAAVSLTGPMAMKSASLM